MNKEAFQSINVRVPSNNRVGTLPFLMHIEPRPRIPAWILPGHGRASTVLLPHETCRHEIALAAQALISEVYVR